MPMGDLVKIVKKNIKKQQQNALPNGIICLKGGELEQEISHFRNRSLTWDLSEFFEEAYFETKKVVFTAI